MEHKPLAISRWGYAFAIAFHCAAAFAGDTEKMSIEGASQSRSDQWLQGNMATLYLSGTIDADAGKRLEAYMVANQVPRESWAILDSPGGNLLGGMELGRVIRKYGLRTDVGKPKSTPPEVLDYEAGGCYSACTLAYLGGEFLYLASGSHFGIHRFAFTQPQQNEADIAQVASASIVEYIRSMNVDPDLFTLSTRAGPSEIYEPPKVDLERLGVVNSGYAKPAWTLESLSGTIYLKGVQDTVYGINKFMLICEKPSKIVLYVIFDAKNRGNQLLSFKAHSIVIDTTETPILPASTKIVNGWFNAEYVLSRGAA
jgi:hypothetical protein